VRFKSNKILNEIMRITIHIIFFFTVTLQFTSCRENIIAPDNFATSVNEPILINEINSYTFVINAKNISIDVTNDTNFNSFASKISITIIDYSSGSVEVRVIDKQLNDRFSYFGNDDEFFFNELLRGYIPEAIGIKAVDFSGKLRIQLNKSF